MFFSKAHDKFLLSNEYKQTIKKYNTLDKIKHLNKKKVKCLYKLELITKKNYEFYLKLKKN